jgi:hypothetical protein
MSSAWENQFATWARPLSDTETSRGENARGMIVKAINAHDVLLTRDIRVFVQGSFRNGTNVRGESDVDIAVCCDEIIHADYKFAPTLDNSIVGLRPARYTSHDLRRDVGEALLDYFGSVIPVGRPASEIRLRYVVAFSGEFRPALYRDHSRKSTDVPKETVPNVATNVAKILRCKKSDSRKCMSLFSLH